MLLSLAIHCLSLSPQAPAAANPVDVVIDHHDNGHARAGFRFERVPMPARSDAAANATFTLVDGRLDRASPGLDALHDGRLPTRADQPDANCFFGRDGGRFVIDLGSAAAIASIGTYSWHPGPRGPQVYSVYVADGESNGFVAEPKRDVDPATCGWQLLARVDTRPAEGAAPGGQHGVRIAADGGLGRQRFVLFDVVPTAAADRSSNTFFSEIDVRLVGATPAEVLTGKSDDGRFSVRIDATAAPALRSWCDDELMPVLLQWYPRIVAMLPRESGEAPRHVDIRFVASGQGAATTAQGRVTCNAAWFAENLRGAATGVMVRELVRVAQGYDAGDARPAWLVDGIADHVRWFAFEPRANGASGIDDPQGAKHDAGGRSTANFLAWAVRVHGKDLLGRLDGALRKREYTEGAWQQLTGKPLAELADDWRRSLVAPPGVAELSEEEKRAGWKLLFNGVDFRGWHSYHQDVVRPGWQIQDGVIVCADPHDAGDLCTDGRYGEFELSIDYRISPGGNSGIMFHVDDSGGATWATGPECQLLDNAAGADPQRAGWLYGLYSTDVDATKPAGEWNTLRILISKERCEHVMNGVRYFEYVMGSDDFAQRLAKSKFARMPGFARFDTGYISLQGDHGLVAFRNIKIRVIGPK